MDEQKEIKAEQSTKDINAGSESKTDKETQKLNAENERLEKAVEKRKELIQKNKELMADKAVSGETEGGRQPVKPAKLTDTEYAEALERGEVNPLKEDGFI